MSVWVLFVRLIPKRVHEMRASYGNEQVQARTHRDWVLVFDHIVNLAISHRRVF